MASSNRSKTTEKVPAILEGMGSGCYLLIGLGIAFMFSFFGGYILRKPVYALAAASAGAVIGLAYYSYKPFNFFAENFYAPKAFSRMTRSELRALGYLNGGGRWQIAGRIASAVVVVTVLGAVSRQMGLKLGQAAAGSTPITGNESAFVVIITAFSSFFLYLFVAPFFLRRRWHWIRENGPLPTAKTLSKYAAKDSKAEWDRLQDTEFSREMESALRGKLSAKFWLVLLLEVLLWAILVVSLASLLLGHVAPGREGPATMIALISGLALYALRRRTTN